MVPRDLNRDIGWGVGVLVGVHIKSTISPRTTNAVGEDMRASECIWKQSGLMALCRISGGSVSTSSFLFDEQDSSCSSGGAGGVVGWFPPIRSKDKQEVERIRLISFSSWFTVLANELRVDGVETSWSRISSEKIRDVGSAYIATSSRRLQGLELIDVFGFV